MMNGNNESYLDCNDPENECDSQNNGEPPVIREGSIKLPAPIREQLRTYQLGTSGYWRISFI